MRTLKLSASGLKSSHEPQIRPLYTGGPGQVWSLPGRAIRIPSLGSMQDFVKAGLEGQRSEKGR